MSSSSPSGKPASSSAALRKPTDPDAVGGCGAPHAASGSEGIEATGPRGASPSNTAPHNSTQHTSDPLGSFRLLRLAVDSLYLSYPGDLKPSVLVVLTKLKALAQSDHPELQAQAQYPVGSHIFEVKDKGARLFPFVLEDNAYRIQLAKPGKKLPMAYVKVSAEYLAHKGPQGVQEELDTILAEFGDLAGANMVSRIDLAADFTSYLAMDSWHRRAWVTRAVEIHNYAKDQNFTGWTIGMGGNIGCRLYDKIQEIVHSGKAWAMNLWIPVGWRPGEPVWRLEFEFKREFLKDRSLSSLDSVLDNLNGLWSYATTEWLRLTLPNEDDATRSRWPIHPLWMALASADWESNQGVLLDKCSTTRPATEIRLITVLLGALTSYMAMHSIDDRNEAIDQLAARLYEHYSLVASKDGQSFDEFLAKRIARKAREFNTAVNEPGLVTDLREQAIQAGAEAYRKASRGD